MSTHVTAAPDAPLEEPPSSSPSPSPIDSDGLGSRPFTRFKRLLVGRPLPSDRLEHERLSKKTALAVLSSDAISSVAYATDQILFVVGGAVGLAAINYVVPISAVIVGLLVLVALSYRQ